MSRFGRGGQLLFPLFAFLKIFEDSEHPTMAPSVSKETFLHHSAFNIQITLPPSYLA